MRSCHAVCPPRSAFLTLGCPPAPPAWRCSEDRLPESIKRGASVLKGTTLLFTKQRDGMLTVQANGLPLAAVRSPTLCTAIM